MSGIVEYSGLGLVEYKGLGDSYVQMSGVVEYRGLWLPPGPPKGQKAQGRVVWG